MITALTLHLTIHPVSEWLGWITLGLVILPFPIVAIWSWLGTPELEALVPFAFCWIAALVTLILFIGSLL